MRTVAAVLLLALTACESEPMLVVGSKNFSENVFLGELVAQHVEARTGLRVERRLNLGGTFICHEALKAGQIDLYPEYTGTALTAILEAEPVKEPAEALRQVRLEYQQRFEAEWAPPFGFEDTYAILVRGDEPEELTTISALAERAGEYRIGFNFEFMERGDGWPGFRETYGLEFAEEPATLDLSLVYQALVDRRIDVAVGNSTHGLIEKFGLRMLEDDRRYFPPYDAAMIVREDAYVRFPGLREALDEIGGAIDVATMRELNRRLDVEQEAPETVAREFLRERFSD